MHQSEAYRILADELAVCRAMPFDELRQLAGESFARQVRAEDATMYDVEVSISRISADELRVEGMVAVSGSGPLRRLDRALVVSSTGVRES